MTVTTPSEQTLAINPASEDEIDLRQVAGALGRRRSWIAGGGALGLLLSGLYLLTTKPVYQGEFQIVLNQVNNQSVRALLSRTWSGASRFGRRRQ